MLWRKLAWMPEKAALRIEVRCAGVVEKDAPSDLPVYPEVPYAFFGFHPGLPRTFHLLDVRYPQVYRTQPLGATRKLTGALGTRQPTKKSNRQATPGGLTWGSRTRYWRRAENARGR